VPPPLLLLLLPLLLRAPPARARVLLGVLLGARCRP
jgi:hypothetical protein